MSQYVLTQEQLDRLQDQINQLTRMNDTKQERIKELERRKTWEQNRAAENLKSTIEKMKTEVHKLSEANERLKNDKTSQEVQMAKVKELEQLLQEERKLREASEALTKQLEQKCAEETLVKELTAELCQLQKAELEIESTRMKEMETKLHYFSHASNNQDFTQFPVFISATQPNNKIKEWNSEHIVRNNQIKIILETLQTQLLNLFNEIKNNPFQTNEEIRRFKELEMWLREANLLMEDIHEIENLNRNLSNLRSEIENKKKSLSK